MAFDYNLGFISVTAALPVVELPDPFKVLDNKGKRSMVHDNCHVGVMDERHLLNVKKTVQQSTGMT